MQDHINDTSLEASSGSAGGKRILVVDDNVDGATTIAEILQILGHTVSVVHDGLSAVRQAEEQRPDIVLLDIGLPDIDGYEAARRMRAQPDGASLVLIALTGWGQEEDREKTVQAGFNQHWVKPVDFEKLAELATLA